MIDVVDIDNEDGKNNSWDRGVFGFRAYRASLGSNVDVDGIWRQDP